MDAIGVVETFNEAINVRNLAVLGELMHEHHRFIDAAGESVEGKSNCLRAWRGFFDAFPDYRNNFEEIGSDASGAVWMLGRSECSTPALVGPAQWRALVEDGLVLQWQVSEIDVRP